MKKQFKDLVIDEVFYDKGCVLIKRDEKFAHLCNLDSKGIEYKPSQIVQSIGILK